MVEVHGIDSTDPESSLTRVGNEISATRCVLEHFTRCSNSLLWKLMMSFYDRKGVESWSQGIVPHFITCNAFIGRLEQRSLSQLRSLIDRCICTSSFWISTRLYASKCENTT
jgi:hypothetical protein